MCYDRFASPSLEHAGKYWLLGAVVQLAFGVSKEGIFAALESEARAAWGEDRARELSQAIGAAAEALWQLSQHPLDLEDEACR